MNSKLTRFIAALLLMLTIVPAQAVLKEENLEKTLNVLRSELQQSYNRQKQILALYEARTEEQHNQLVLTVQKCNQLSLILYSQRDGFTFDIAYACQQATDMYNETHKSKMPNNDIRQRMKSEVERYDLLVASLESLPPSLRKTAAINKTKNEAAADTAKIAELQHRLDSITEAYGQEPFTLDDDAQETRNECVIYAKALRNNIARLMTKIEQDSRHYDQVLAKVDELNTYAQKKYEDLRQSIFLQRNDNYLTILARLPMMLKITGNEVNEKYTPFHSEVGKNHEGKVHHHDSNSQWRGPIIPLTSVFVLFYVVISTVLSYIVTRWLVPARIRNIPDYKKKQPVLLLAAGFVIFMISMGIVSTFLVNNFLIMAVQLLLEFSWLITFILLSLLFRLSGEQIKEGVKQYTPFLAMAFIVILFRIVFIPNNLVNLIFPPLLVIFTLWQANTLRKREVQIPGSDMVYTVISLVAMLLACVASFIGYTLLAVEIMIWWTFQLACIQTITFLFDLCNLYETRHLFNRVQNNYRIKNHGKSPADKVRAIIERLRTQLDEATTDEEKNALTEKIADSEKRLEVIIFNIRDGIVKKMAAGDYISQTWFFDFVTKALIPVLAVISVLVSIYMAADMFDMTDIFFKYLSHDFVSTSFIHLSVNKLCIVVSMLFVFKYINYAVHAVYREVHKKRTELIIEQEKRKQRERGRQGEEIALPNTNTTLANNVITLLVWGSYFIIILYMLNVPKSGITIITTGLATGMGFAMKDLLENFFYGLSLMTGRIRIGDYIECDGIAGKVDSITYQSTQVVTRDGCVIAFLNSQLFSKNFKNLTRNHKYEMVKIPIGVAYGTNVQHVRELLVDRINQLITAKREKTPNIVKAGTTVSVAFSGFGDSSVDLLVIVWVLVEEKVGFTSEANEAIYNVLNDNNIEIPFPQHDVHVRDTVALPLATTDHNPQPEKQ